MKILLLGEYSRLHNSLKEGLTEHGHEVFLAGFTDYFKDFPVDFKFELNYQAGLKSLYKNLIYKLFKIDLNSKAILSQFEKNKHLFEGYDVVQLINENTFKTLPKTEIKILDYIFKKNNKVFLLSCGADYSSVNYAYENKLRYSILSPLKEAKVSEKKYQSILKYISRNYKELHRYIYKKIDGVIASDLDYHLPLLDSPKYLGLIPNPVNTDIIQFKPQIISNKIKIFHGINSNNYYKKGSDLFMLALKNLKTNYPGKIEIKTVRDLPYKEYISSYNDAHIILDQVYSYDQGYNALEAMAKGKVVFTGAEQEWLDFYGVEKDTVVINAEPDVEQIVEKLEWLIKNPEKIIEISNNARKFIEEHHNYINIAKAYIESWKNT